MAQKAARKFNVYADLKNGLGVCKVNKVATTREKATAWAGRLLKAASRVYAVKVA